MTNAEAKGHRSLHGTHKKQFLWSPVTRIDGPQGAIFIESLIEVDFMSFLGQWPLTQICMGGQANKMFVG